MAKVIAPSVGKMLIVLALGLGANMLGGLSMAGELIGSTYFGGSDADGLALGPGTSLAVDASGNIYLATVSRSPEFRDIPGVHEFGPGGGTDVVLALLNANLTQLVAIAVIGGSADENTAMIVAGRDGGVYLVTQTGSADYPTTPGAYSRTWSGPTDIAISLVSSGLSELLASTYDGGLSGESWPSIAVDSGGYVFIGGVAVGAVPTNPQSYDQDANGGMDFFVAKLAPDLSSWLAATYLGGRFNEEYPTVMIDDLDQVIVTGKTGSDDYPTSGGAFDVVLDPIGPDEFNPDACISKFSNDLSVLVASTFLGGSGGEVCFYGAVDGAGNVFVAGHGGATDFPVSAGAFDPIHGGGDEFWVSKLNHDLTELLASTYLTPDDVGISESIFGNALACDRDGNVMLTGVAWGANMPTTMNAYNTALNGPNDAMLFVLNPDLSALLYGSYLGGTQREGGMAVLRSPAGNLVVAGTTGSSDFPVLPGAYDQTYAGGTDRDVFVSKLGFECCTGRVGDANGSGSDEPTIADIALLIDVKFVSNDHSQILCTPEADVNQSGGLEPTVDDVTIADISWLIDYLFITGPSPTGLNDCL